ncbi:hypothetical protein BJF90_43660 [Pseudonocardia sp. CNS-004]|nr:hypothetical protein BJF90_43660 [Pseudonocardia sp. CNS-004]
MIGVSTRMTPTASPRIPIRAGTVDVPPVEVDRKSANSVTVPRPISTSGRVPMRSARRPISGERAATATPAVTTVRRRACRAVRLGPVL